MSTPQAEEEKKTCAQWYVALPPKERVYINTNSWKEQGIPPTRQKQYWFFFPITQAKFKELMHNCSFSESWAPTYPFGETYTVQCWELNHPFVPYAPLDEYLKEHPIEDKAL